MPKIMLVEDDNSLREIYEARLAAEGYTIVSAKDGEEALAMALKERPDLIIADVMMPKVSGFDMLDILRSTPETKNTKIIMMTALSQAEDKARAEKLGADRYLVKSQVTLEDVTREAHTILAELESQAAATVANVENPAPAAPAANPTPAPAPATPAPATPTPPADSAAPATDPAQTPAPATPAPASTDAVTLPVASPAATTSTDTATASATTPTTDTTIAADTTQPTVTSIPVTAAPVETKDTPKEESPKETTPEKPVEDKKKAVPTPSDAPATATEPLEEVAKELSTPVKEEKTQVKEQIDEFIASNPTLSESPEPATAKDSAANDTASAAVDSLTKPTADTEQDTTTTDKEPKPTEEPQSRGYVAANTDGEKPSASLEHTKRIEPSPDALKADEKPDLNELLAKEGESLGSDAMPAVNTVINPNQPSTGADTSPTITSGPPS